MLDASFKCPTQIVLERNAEAKVGSLIKAYGGTKVLLHYGSGHAVRSGLIDRVRANLRENQIPFVDFGGASSNPKLSLVYEGISLCKKENVDFVLAVGGGSTIDSAKAIAMGAVYEGDVWTFFRENAEAEVDAVPQAALPIGVVLTIAAAGSESSMGCVISKEDESLKRSVDTDLIRPRFALENPELTMSLPWFQTASSIADIMSHSMERYFTPVNETGNPLTDRLCESVFFTLMECAGTLKENPRDYNARANLMLVSGFSHNGITGFGRTGDWACHFIEHELSAEYNVTHGAGLAVVTPAWMKYVYRDNLPLFVQWAVRVMGAEYHAGDLEKTALEGIQKLEDFFIGIGLAVRISGMREIKEPVTEEALWRMAKRARPVRADGTLGYLKHLNAQDVYNILQLAK